MMVWNSTMSTGVTELDEQHRELIKRLNELVSRMHHGEGNDALQGLLDFLTKYSAWHFAQEENCMEAHRCPAAGANKKAHGEFIRVFTTLRNRLAFEGPTAGLAVDTQRQLSAWLLNHIVGVDSRLKECVRQA